MFSSPSPTPHPGAAERTTASQEAMPVNHPPAEQTPSAPEHQREDRLQAHRRDLAIPPSAEMSPPSRSIDVRRSGFDPFIIGVAIGAIAAILGLVIGLYVLLVM
jgi:hypothetical protein